MPASRFTQSSIGNNLRRMVESKGGKRPECPLRFIDCEYVSERCPDGCVRIMRQGGKVTVRLVDKDALGRPIGRGVER